MADERKKAKAKEKGRRYVSKLWKELLNEGKKARKRFDEDAREAMSFFDGPHDKSFVDSKAMDWDSWFKLSINKTAEVVSVVGPALFWKRPVRTVTTRSEDYTKRSFAKVLERYLNFTPRECNPPLKESSRKAITEALVKGRGCLWTALDQDTNLVTSEFVTVDDIVVDPDARDMTEARWVARRRSEPAWLVKDLYPKHADEIDTYAQSITHQAQNSAENELTMMPGESNLDDTASAPIRHGKTADIVVYWEVFSKMGVGVRSRLAQKESDAFDGIKDDKLEKYIVVAEGMKTPLEIGDWPAPLHLDGEYPCTFLDFIWKPQLEGEKIDSWPLHYLKSSMGEQKAMDYIASFMLTKAKNSARELVGVKKELGEEAKRQVLRGRDREVIVVDSVDPNESLRGMVDFLQPPQGGANDLMEMFKLVQDLFERRSGLGELMYGSGRGIRSAREAEIKDRNTRIRVEDMAMVVEEWQSKVARKEAILARFILDPEDIEKVCDPSMTYGWAIDIMMGDQVIAPELVEQIFPAAKGHFETQEEVMPMAQEINAVGNQMGLFARPVPITSGRVWRDVHAGEKGSEEIVREYSIMIEATSARRPDRTAQIATVDRMFQHVGMPALQVGDMDSYNGVLELFYGVMEVPQENRIFLTQPPPPEEMAPPAEEMPPEGGGQILQGPTPAAGPEDPMGGSLPLMPGSEQAIIPGAM